MSDIDVMTLFLGPQTRLALTLNALVRGHRMALAGAGLNARPGRMATPHLRRNLDRDTSPSDRQARFREAVGEGPMFLSAVNFLGPTALGFHRREMFPETETLLAELPVLAAGARLVLSLDTLPAFFLAAGSEPLEERVRSAGWEPLYELSWADLVEEIAVAMPGSDILVLTPRGAAVRSPEVLARLFGDAASVLPAAWHLLEAAISETGRAVLAQRLAEVGQDDAALTELFDTFAERAAPDDLAARLGIDRVTGILLEQRFAEDLDRIRAMPRVEVI